MLQPKDGFKLMRNEALGSLSIGVSRERALRLIGSAPKLGKREKWGADGRFHQPVDFPRVGMSLSLVSDTPSSAQRVESIAAKAPCTRSTKRGIHIGSPETNLIKAYRAE